MADDSQYMQGGLAMPPNPQQIAMQLGAGGSAPQVPASQLKSSDGIAVDGSAPQLPGTGGDSPLDAATAKATLDAAVKAQTDFTQQTAGQQRIKAIQEQADKIYAQLLPAEMDKARADADAKAQKAQSIQSAREQLKLMLDALKKKESIPDDAPPDYKPQSPLEKFGSLSSMLGIFASAFTRTPVVNALNASASAMKAIDAGDVEGYNRAYEKWKTHSELVMKRTQMDLERLKDILDIQDKDLSLSLAQSTAFAAERGWKAVGLNAQAGDLEGLAKLYESTGKALSGYKEQMDMLKEYNERLSISVKEESLKEKKELDNPPPEGLHDAAKVYAITGVLPATGMGGAAYKEKVIQEAAKIRKEAGITVEDVIAGRAGVKADTSSLNRLQPQADAVLSFERTAKANMENALRLMNKGAGTEAGPVINRWLQAGRKETGDPDVKAFNAALYTATVEYLKAMSGSTTSGQAMTDSARNEMTQEIINKYDSPEAIKAVYNETMVPDMENRKEGLLGQIKDIKSRISGWGNTFEPKTGGVKSGTAPVPKGIDPEDWKYLSADEQAKFGE